jgi:CDP-paratose 2-epimerase
MEKLFRDRKFDAVFHEASQVAVMTAVEDPRLDFEVNTVGTFNLLEGIRLSGQRPIFIFASTNKVYGPTPTLKVEEHDGRYALADLPTGIPETLPLNFYSPLGCSKGAADQYILDYRRVYGLRSLVFRQSCIYGPAQLGMEEQGWVAWFAICALLGRTLTIYGDGKQVRDLLFIDDLVDLYYRAIEVEPTLSAAVYNVGGGPEQAVSLFDVIGIIEEALDHSMDLKFSDWRTEDQRVFVVDNRKAKAAFGWSPKVFPKEGIARMIGWIKENKNLFA